MIEFSRGKELLKTTSTISRSSNSDQHTWVTGHNKSIETIHYNDKVGGSRGTYETS